jgi:hypothetical protein
MSKPSEVESFIKELKFVGKALQQGRQDSTVLY